MRKVSLEMDLPSVKDRISLKITNCWVFLRLETILEVKRAEELVFGIRINCLPLQPSDSSLQ